MKFGGAGNWTILPPLTLRGVGTSHVESLQHYADRLLWVTGLIPAELRELIRWKDGKSNRSAIVFDGGLTAKVLSHVDRLELLTGAKHLRCGTLWALSDILSMHSNLYGGQRRRWCPVCYEYWDELSYEPLMWSIDLASCCPIHECKFEHACSHCGNFQRNVHELDRRRFCSSCKKPLGHEARPGYLPGFLIWVDQQVHELVEYCATPREMPMGWHSYARFVRGLRLNARASGVVQESMRLILRDMDRHAKRRSRRPSMRSLINLCALQGISMTQLLNAPDESSGPSLFEQYSGLRYLPLPSAFQAQRIYMATRLIEHFFEQRPAYYPPISQLLRPLNVQRLGVRDAVPELYDAYEARYQSQGNRDRLKKLSQAYMAADYWLGSTGRDADSRSIALEIVDAIELAMDDAVKVLAGAVAVNDARAFYRLDGYRKELPTRSAVEWVTGRWSELVHQLHRRSDQW